MVDRQIRFQREADPEWARRVCASPGCERLNACTQCGNCSGTCPLSIYMDITPRRIMALLREGFRNDVLHARTIWLCSSCFACSTDCPQGIRIADLMFALKREAIANRVFPKRFPVRVLAHEFSRIVHARGRSPELWLALRMALRSQPLALPGLLKLAWRLRRRGRLAMRTQGLYHLAQFRGAMGQAREGE